MTPEDKSSDSKSSKKTKRIESKKRKAAAFLQLAKDVDAVKTSLEDSDDEDHTQAKIQKIPEAFGNVASFVPQETSAEILKGKSMEESKPKLSGEALLELRKALRERQKLSQDKSKLFLTLDDLASEYGVMLCKESPVPTLPPLFMMDVQHLLLYALQGNLSSYRPRWCKLLRPSKIEGVVVIVLDGVGSDDYQTHPECFPNIQKYFEMSVDMVSPEEYGSSVAEELLYVPLSLREKMKRRETQSKTQIVNIEPMAPIIGGKVPQTEPASVTLETQEIHKEPEIKIESELLPASDRFPRTHLLLSTSQMVLEGFPMPNLNTNTEFIYSKDDYGTVTNHSPIFAIDCEMCLTVRLKSEVTRISVVNEDLECIYDTFVKPHHRIRDYVTKYSGITKQILDPVQTRLSDVQKYLRKILPDDAILCGQSLCGDLNALQMFHPYVMDTSVMYNLNGDRKRKTGLRRLASVFLKRDIQGDASGHNSIEDASATMELVKLKLANDIAFGDCVIGGAIFPPEEKSDVEPKPDLQSVQASEEEIKDQNTSVAVELQSKSESLSHTQIVARKKSFFHNISNSQYKSLFSITKDVKKTAALVDEASVVQQHADQEVVAIVSDCDRTSKSLSKSYVEFHDFVYTCFPSYKKEDTGKLTEEEKQKLLGRMDKRLGKVLKHTKVGSLVTVILPGQSSSGKCQCAKTFIKIV
ncbi:RNA exonuclease 5-like isoform X2 [Ylistrum balloti]|uniref:RNA exonuclease 5-like isoform X2 n=1 Tax=Ylistrum balloti TaxID=509963 RepID=UPI0029057F5E|nr:RNA exonuclease 5-like isoform X2 [Ylistrum balloti]